MKQGLLGVLRFIRRRWLLLLALLAVLVGIDVRFIEPYWPKVVEKEVYFDDLPGAFDYTRVLLISDTHCDSVADRKYLTRQLKMIERQGANMILLLGDYTSLSSQDNVDFMLNWMKQLEAPLGVYAILGNHDYKPYDRVDGVSLADYYERELAGSHVTLLRNKAVTVKRDEQAIRLIGLGDKWYSDCHPSKAWTNEMRGPFTVLLYHNPDGFYYLSDYPFDLMTSGHTHGGQVCVPFFGPILLPIEHKELCEGWFSNARQHLYVTAGLGSLRPIRFYCRPDITVLTLRRGHEKTKGISE